MTRRGAVSIATTSVLRDVVYVARTNDIWAEVRPCKKCKREIWVYDLREADIPPMMQGRVGQEFYAFDRKERDHRKECGT
jgi:hypothetical protein